VKAPPWVHALSERWRRVAAARADLWPGDPLAAALPQLARELEAEAERHDAEALTIREAAQESGYSQAHLRDMVRQGVLPATGTDGPVRVRRGDLPRRSVATQGQPVSSAARELGRSVQRSRSRR